jgi:hypothetical protein
MCTGPGKCAGGESVCTWYTHTHTHTSWLSEIINHLLMRIGPGERAAERAAYLIIIAHGAFEHCHRPPRKGIDHYCDFDLGRWNIVTFQDLTKPHARRHIIGMLYYVYATFSCTRRLVQVTAVWTSNRIILFFRVRKTILINEPREGFPFSKSAAVSGIWLPAVAAPCGITTAVD